MRAVESVLVVSLILNGCATPLEAYFDAARRAERYWDEGKFDEAVEKLEKAAEIASTANLRIRRADALGRLSYFYPMVDRFDSAESVARDALEIYESEPAGFTRDEWIFGILTHMGELDQRSHRYCAAISKFTRARSMVHETPSNVDWTRRFLGRVYLDVGRYDLAVSEFEESVEFASEFGIFGEFSDSGARALLAHAYSGLEDHPRALEETQKSIRSIEAIRGIDDESLEVPLTNTAYYLIMLERYADAEAALNRALGFDRSAGALENLALLRIRQGRLEEARVALEDAFSRLDDRESENSHQFPWKWEAWRLRWRAILTGRLASLRAHEGEYEDAERLFAESLALFDERYGPDNIETLWVLEAMRDAYAGSGDAEAEAATNDRIDIVRERARTWDVESCFDTHPLATG